jgi:tetratricopeptide (TPR) repeat protein
MGPKEYVKHLGELRKIHEHRDDGFAAAEKHEGIERARSLAGALRSLETGFEDGSDSLENSEVDIFVRFYRDEIDTVMRLDADNGAGLRAHFDDLLHRGDRLAEDEAFFNLLRSVDKDNKGADEAMRLLDKRIAESDSPWIRNRARRVRLASLEWAKRHEEALAYARELAADETYSLDDRRWLRTRIAWNLWRLHRDDEAAAVLDRLIAEVHDNPRQQCRYLCDKAEWGLWDAGRYAEALETLSAAIKLVKPDTVEWLRVQGWRANYLERLDRVADACAVYETLIASKVSGPIDRADCFTAMAIMLDKHGSRAAAVDAAAKAQQVLDHEVTSPATNSVAQIQSRINKITGAKPAETKAKATQGKNNP